MRPQANEIFSMVPGVRCLVLGARLINLKFNPISVAAYPTQIIIEFVYQLQCNQSAFSLKWPIHITINIHSDFVAVKIMIKTNFYRSICCGSLLLTIAVMRHKVAQFFDSNWMIILLLQSLSN